MLRRCVGSRECSFYSRSLQGLGKKKREEKRKSLDRGLMEDRGAFRAGIMRVRPAGPASGGAGGGKGGFGGKRGKGRR